MKDNQDLSPDAIYAAMADDGVRGRHSVTSIEHGWKK